MLFSTPRQNFVSDGCRGDMEEYEASGDAVPVPVILEANIAHSNVVPVWLAGLAGNVIVGDSCLVQLVVLGHPSAGGSNPERRHASRGRSERLDGSRSDCSSPPPASTASCTLELRKGQSQPALRLAEGGESSGSRSKKWMVACAEQPVFQASDRSTDQSRATSAGSS